MRCLALASGEALRLDAAALGCLALADLSRLAGGRGLRIRFDGAEVAGTLRGVTIEVRLDDVGSAECLLLTGVETPVPPPGAVIEVSDRETDRVLFRGLVDEPETEVLPAEQVKVETIRAVGPQRRLEDLRLSTAEGVAVAREPTWQAQARRLLAALQAASAHDAQFSLAAGDWVDTDPPGPPAEHDFRGESLAGALRAVITASGDGALYVGPDHAIQRTAQQTGPATVLAEGVIGVIALDVDRQHQHTRACLIGAAPFELVDTFVGRQAFYDLGQTEGRVSLFQPPGSGVALPGVLWAHRTSVPGAFFTGSDYRADNRGIYATTHVKGDDPTWPAIWRASTRLAASSTTAAEAYVVSLVWTADEVRLDLGATDRDRTAVIDWAAGVDPWVLARTLGGQVSRARLAAGDPSTSPASGAGLVDPGWQLHERIETDTVLVDGAHANIDVGLATTLDVTNPDGRPPLRVRRLVRVEREVQPGGPDDFIDTALTNSDGDPLWRLDEARHRVIAPETFVAEDVTVLSVRITYEAVWEVEADAGGPLPIIHIETAEEAATREVAREAALRAIADAASPVQVIEVTLTADAARHLEPGDRVTIDGALLGRLGAPVAAGTETVEVPVWVIDAVTITDEGDRLIYRARATRARHQSEYSTYWRQVTSGSG